MAYYNTCPHCGANLDPSEHCDCMREREDREEFYRSVTKRALKTGQLSFSLKNREVMGYEKTTY